MDIACIYQLQQNLKASKDIAAENYKPVQENITSGLSTPLHFGHAGMW